MRSPAVDYEVLELPDFDLEQGGRLRPARLAFRTYGALDAERANAILFPTWFAGRHSDNEWLIGPGRALDTDRYFVVVPNMFGNGLSSSPSNTAPPWDRARFPAVTIRDNVNAQHRLVTEHLGISRLALVTGCSMGGCQTYQWAVSHPELVERAMPFCGAPRTAPHTRVFIEGVRAALTADGAWNGGWYEQPPERGLRAFARVYAGWGFSQAFYWDAAYRELGFTSIEDFLVGFWEANFLEQDANDLLAMLGAWARADIGATPGFDGDLVRALKSIRAKLLTLPSEKDLYFPPEDERWAAQHIPHAEVRVVPGVWGHLAGGGLNAEAGEFIADAVRGLLATPVR